MTCSNFTTNAVLRASIVCGTALAGFILYVLVLVAILRTKELIGKSYYRLLVSLGLADCLGLLVFIIYSSTAILCGPHDIWGGRTANGSWGAVLNIGWFSAIPSMVVLAINRYVQMNRSSIYAHLFNGRTTIFWIIACWTIGIIISVPTFLPDCYILYDHTTSAWSWNIQNYCSDLYAKFELCFALSSGAVSIGLFACIMVRIKSMHNEIIASSSKKTRSMSRKTHRIREIRLTIQCFLVTVYFICYDIALVICSYVPINETQALLLTMGYILNNCINVVVYLSLNNVLRRKTFSVLFSGKSSIVETTRSNDSKPNLLLSRRRSSNYNSMDTSNVFNQCPLRDTVIKHTSGNNELAVAL